MLLQRLKLSRMRTTTTTNIHTIITSTTTTSRATIVALQPRACGGGCSFATFTTSGVSIQETSWQRMNDRTRQLALSLSQPEHNFDGTSAAFGRNNTNNNDIDVDESVIRSIRFQRRMALARAITLVESKAAAHREQADLLLTYLLNSKGTTTTAYHHDQSFRVGLAGPPGAGKSTFIECFGKYILDLHHQQKTKNNPVAALSPTTPTTPATMASVDSSTQTTNTSSLSSSSSSSITMAPFLPEKLAVVCIDPSSSVTGGSILGDKTRMIELSRHERSFVRPSANGGTFGGLSAYTHDVVSLCQAADYRLVLVETVGLGQSEVEVAESVDMLILVVPPGGGDELQGVKKGIVEVADMLLVTKADGNLLPAARSTASDYKAAMTFQRQRYPKGCGWGPTPPVLLTSAVTGEGMDRVWNQICKFRMAMIQSKELQRKRQGQNKYWMWKNLQNLITARTKEDAALQHAARQMELALLNGTITPRVAAAELLDCLLRSSSSTTSSSSAASS